MVRDSFSIVRLRAACAALVMESASSRMMILNGGQGFPLMERRTDKNMCNTNSLDVIMDINS